jgi:hypothetical protein
MNRLTIINFINPSWFTQITGFLCEHPAFAKLIPIVALDEYPNGFNKNPHETDENVPLNIFEIMVYGLSYANVDIDYGKIQYLLLTKYLRQITEYTRDMEFPEETQPEKVRTYRELVNTLLDNNIVVTEMTYEQLPVVENVWGMTESTITLLHLLFDEVTTDRCLPYADKQFKRGMTMFYDLENPTKEELKAITDTWTNKKVGLMFIVQFAHYSDYLE